MNAPERIDLPDIQSQPDTRGIAIDAVGIKGIRYPVTVVAGERLLPTIGTFSMGVGLSALAKGTHMSRFVELLERQPPLSQEGFRAMTADMLKRLDSRSGTLTMRFPYFMSQCAPVSGVRSLLDCDVAWRCSMDDGGGQSFRMRITVPVTSLCPCSKRISDYGAHNQRSHVTIDARIAAEVAIDELIGLAQSSASCEIYGLLKRVDEKYVTERAYDNPKFVEDIVRDAAAALDSDPRITSYAVEAENFESIHNHSAFAEIARDPQRSSIASGLGLATPR
jgi:GTP cyclohydrolase FolE2